MPFTVTFNRKSKYNLIIRVNCDVPIQFIRKMQKNLKDVHAFAFITLRSTESIEFFLLRCCFTLYSLFTLLDSIVLNYCYYYLTEQEPTT